MREAQARAEGRGFAVVAVLLLILGLTALAHGALLLAAQDRIASTLEARLVHRRVASVAVARAPNAGDTLPELGPSPRPLRIGSAPPLHWRTDATALSPEFVLLTGVAEIDGLPGEARTGAVVWRLDPSARTAAVAAVVETARGVAIEGGSIGAEAWLSALPSDPRCVEELRAVLALGGGRVAPSVTRPSLPISDGEAPLPSLGLLGGDSLLARVAARLAGVVTPEPQVMGGRCLEGTMNWGSPSEPAGPCGFRWIVAAADRDLEIRGGEGQGVLLVPGELRFTEGVSFAGVVLVGGDLILEEGSTLTGMAIVGAARLRSGARIDGSACAVARALRAAPSLRWPTPLPGGRVQPL